MNLEEMYRLPPHHRANAERQLREQRNPRTLPLGPEHYVEVDKSLASAAKQFEIKLIRQKTKQPTKLHRDWGEVLRRRYPGRRIREESVTLKLCNGIRYTPDWFVTGPSYDSRAYECKGFMRDDARKSLIFAAKEFPEIRFILAWRTKGVWHEQEILA